MIYPLWAYFVSAAFGALVVLASISQLVLWWFRYSTRKNAEKWDEIMFRCKKGEKVGQLLSPSEQILRAECTCDDFGPTAVLMRPAEGNVN